MGEEAKKKDPRTYIPRLLIHIWTIQNSQDSREVLSLYAMSTHFLREVLSPASGGGEPDSFPPSPGPPWPVETGPAEATKGGGADGGDCSRTAHDPRGFVPRVNILREYHSESRGSEEEERVVPFSSLLPQRQSVAPWCLRTPGEAKPGFNGLFSSSWLRYLDSYQNNNSKRKINIHKSRSGKHSISLKFSGRTRDNHTTLIRSSSQDIKFPATEAILRPSLAD